MNIRFRRGLALAALTAAGMLALSGCKLPGTDDKNTADPTPAAPAASATGTPKSTPNGKASASAKPKAGANGLPDVCQLLSKAEVSALAGGRPVVQVDEDGAAADAGTRYCQWQMNGARLAVFLSPTSPEDFATQGQQGQDVGGIGDDAFTNAGHLYVRVDNLQIDVYATVSGAEATAKTMAKNTALKVIGKL